MHMHSILSHLEYELVVCILARSKTTYINHVCIVLPVHIEWEYYTYSSSTTTSSYSIVVGFGMLRSTQPLEFD